MPESIQSVFSSLLRDISTCWTLAFEGLLSALGSKPTHLKCSTMDVIVIEEGSKTALQLQFAVSAHY